MKDHREWMMFIQHYNANEPLIEQIQKPSIKNKAIREAKLQKMKQKKLKQINI